MNDEAIEVRGARVHNLKNISFSIPHNQMTVVTGVSGSGKSSLAFDTVYAEGQRRYVESLSAYARQFLERMDKPDVDEVRGIAPAIAIRQKNSTRNPRSTVGTQTEIYDYLRLLYARVVVCGDQGILRGSRLIEPRLHEPDARLGHVQRLIVVPLVLIYLTPAEQALWWVFLALGRERQNCACLLPVGTDERFLQPLNRFFAR